VTQPPQTSIQQGAVVVIAIIMAFAAMAIASSVFAPIAFAFFIVALAWPMQKGLQRVLPKVLALAISLVVMIALFAALGSLVLWAFGRVVRWFLSDAARLQSYYDAAILWLEGHGVPIAGVWSENFNTSWMLRMAQRITARLNSTMSFWVVVLVYVALGLLEVEDFDSKIRRMRNGTASAILLRGSAATAAKIRRYMLVRTWMSLVTGLLVWGLAKFLGLHFAEEWGFIAFSLNYIPFLGPLIATLFPSMFALTQFGSWEIAISVLVGLNLIQTIVGSYIEPRLAGSALSLSPVVVLFSVFLWSYLWGIFGAFIGVPITIAVVTFCAQHPSSLWVAEILGSPDSGLTPDELKPDTSRG
jgi:predicted PurR-regulated permease PerM